MEQTDSFEAIVNNIKEDKTISEIKDLIENYEYADEDDFLDELADFINEFEYYKDLDFNEMKDALTIALNEKLADFDPEVIAVAKYFDCDPDEVEAETYDQYGLNVYSYGREEVAVGTDEQATEAATEEIKSSLWAFNANFISSHTKNGLSDRAERALEKMQGELCEDANDIVEALIEDMDEFIDDAISADGRGHFLNHYDGMENEEEVDGETYYIYRIN